MSTTELAVEFKKRKRIYFLTFAIALIVSLPEPPHKCISPALLVMLAYFPSGLMIWLLGPLMFGSWASFLCLTAGGWILYAIHAFITLQVRKQMVFYSLYGVLLVLLVFNVTGCHNLNDAFKDKRSSKLQQGPGQADPPNARVLCHAL